MEQLDKSGELDRSKFKELVDHYISNFRDDHIVFYDDKARINPADIGFRVRRYKDALYVINTNQEKSLEVGTQIIELDDMQINEAAEKFHRELMDQPNERQLWENIIKKCKTITVINNGKRDKFNISLYPYMTAESKYECKCITNDTIILRYNDFMDYELSRELLSQYQQEIIRSKNIIIDVRINSGGNDSVFLEILNFIFPEDFSIKKEYSTLTNVTERNYNNRMKMLSEYLEEHPDDEMLKKYINELTINKNKGFVTLNLGSGRYKISGMKGEKNVIVLTDRYCGSSGDSFVIFASHSPWVTIIGRPTYGIIDYYNVAEQKLENGFSLYYPTSVYEGAIYGKGYDNIGVRPDIYIPWTPEHINRDVDLEYALEFLKGKSCVEIGI